MEGFVLGTENVGSINRLLLHSSASHKASVCSNWLWIRSYWLKVSKINKYNKAVLYVWASKILTMQVLDTKRQNNKIANCCMINHRGSISLGCQRLFFTFYSKINKGVILKILMSVLKALWSTGAEMISCISAPWKAPVHFALYGSQEVKGKPLSETESDPTL